MLGNFALMTEENRNFLYVWFVLYFFRLWRTIRFFIGVFDKSLTEKNTKVMDVLLYMQAFGDPAQAFGNCVLYCFLDSSVRGRLSEFCCHTSGLYRNRVSSSRRSSSSLMNYGSTNVFWLTHNVKLAGETTCWCYIVWVYNIRDFNNSFIAKVDYI